MAADRFFHPTDSGEWGNYTRNPFKWEFKSGPITWKWTFSAKATPVGAWPPMRLTVDGAPATGWVDATPRVGGGQHAQEYVFTFSVPNGHHIAGAEGHPADVEILYKPFTMNDSASPLADNEIYVAPVRFERQYQVSGPGYTKVTYPGSLPTPKIFPLKPRVIEPFNTLLSIDELWCRRIQQHVQPSMTRRFTTLADGTVVIEADQKYYYHDTNDQSLTPPSMTLRDGPRGVGSLGFLYKFVPSPANNGWYWMDVNGRMGFLWDDGRVSTLVGWRIKPGELKAHSSLRNGDKEFYDSRYEHVGDWSQVPDPKRFREPWGMDGLGSGKPGDGLHEFWIADTLNHRILYVNHYTAHAHGSYSQPLYAPPGYVAPAEPTGQSQVFVFADDLNEPWDVAISPDKVWLYWTEFAGNCIKRKPLKGGPTEVVLNCSRQPTDAQLGISAGHRLEQGLHVDTLRPLYLVDGPNGTATCCRPQGIAFDSKGNVRWAERYVYALRVLENGTARTLANIPITGRSFGQRDVSFAIDKEGTFGPTDDMFIGTWNEGDRRFASDGTYRGRTTKVAGGTERFVSGYLKHVKKPEYAWAIGIGHGRMVMQGSGGGWQIIEVSKRQPGDTWPDISKAQRGYQAFHSGHLGLTHGPSGQGELGYPTLEEMGSWDDATLTSYLQPYIAIGDVSDVAHWIRLETQSSDYSGGSTEPPPPPEEEMKVIIATLTVAQSAATFPAGSDVGAFYRFSLSGGSKPDVDIAYDGTAGPFLAEFEDVAAGTYTVTVRLLNASESQLGNEITSASIVVDPDVEPPADIVLSVPAGLTVQVITR